MNSVTIFSVIGIALVGGVGVKLAIASFLLLRRSVWQREVDRLERQLFEERIEAAKALRVRNEGTRFAWNGYRKLIIDRKVQEADGVCSLYLTPHDHKPLPSYEPGQFLTFQLRIPGVEKPEIRCYSLSYRPRSDYYRVTIKRCLAPPNTRDVPPGLVSNFFHDCIKEGDIVDARAPAGKFVIDPRHKRPAVLLAAGVGITPLLSMLTSVAESGLAREMWLFYGVRNGAEHAMRHELHELSEQSENVHIITCYSDPREGKDVKGRDHDHHGRVTVELLKQHLETNNYEFFICGPPPMMNSLKKGLAEWGVPKNDIRTEAFGAKSVARKEPAAKDVPTLTVEFSKSGKSVQWDGSASNLLEFGIDCGADLQGGCRAGNCGTCEIAVLKGSVEYTREPEYPDLKEGCCLTCIGVPQGDLVLDG